MSKKQAESPVGTRIRRVREVRGMSQEDLAHEIGMSTGNVGKIERGMVDPNTATLFRIASVLKVDITDFFSESETVSEPSIKKFVGRQEFDETIGQLWSDIVKLKRDLEVRAGKPGGNRRKK